MADFLIVIPAYNEEKNIGKVLQGLADIQVKADILVINDGSIDRTEQIANNHQVFVVSHPTNLGYGAALQTGFKFASLMKYKYIIQFDSDNQHDPRDLQVIMKELQQGTSDVVIGSRFLGDPEFNPGFLKLVAIKFFRQLIYGATKTKITDPTSGIRGLTRRVFEYYSLKDRFPADYPDADMAIHMLLHQFVIVEAPVHHRLRTEGESMHVGLRPVVYLIKVLLSTLSVIVNYKLGKRRGIYE